MYLGPFYCLVKKFLLFIFFFSEISSSEEVVGPRVLGSNPPWRNGENLLCSRAQDPLVSCGFKAEISGSVWGNAIPFQSRSLIDSISLKFKMILILKRTR